jgi:hypothetical protein
LPGWHTTRGGEPEDLDEYMQTMRDEQRLIFEFDIQRTYGQF